MNLRDRAILFAAQPGKRFGRLTVVGEAPRSANGDRQWRMVCDCGIEKLMTPCNVRNGFGLGCARRAPRGSGGGLCNVLDAELIASLKGPHARTYEVATAPPADYQPAQLRNVRALVQRVPSFVFDLGSRP